MTTWHLRSRDIDEEVVAVDQHAAFNTLRRRPLRDFGLVVTAIPNGDEEAAFSIQTASLMRSWGRPNNARAADAKARELGLL